ncbi:MAG TPA: GNAT family N-acetyltransferase [Pyrinomonadaceae bacterium]|nr:GNAT family N-acetyltransferase [Pyrinomonadaceae bacterium]
MSTPDLYIKTNFVLDEHGRIVSTREPGAPRGPLVAVSKSLKDCAWAVRADVPPAIANEIDRLAQLEIPPLDLQQGPTQSHRYIALLIARITPNQASVRKTIESDGPAFEFPARLIHAREVVVIENEQLLNRNFSGWVPGEIEAGRGPVMAIVENGHPVSVCFCARRSDTAAEAGVETADAYRGRGYASRVTAAWALAVRNSGRVPLYSTIWSNKASLAVARKLKLSMYANSWALVD